jgi:hypothetical protein
MRAKHPSFRTVFFTGDKICYSIWYKRWQGTVYRSSEFRNQIYHKIRYRHFKNPFEIS